MFYFFSATYREQDFHRRLQDRALTTAKLLIVVNEVDNKLLKIIDRNTINALFHEQVIILDSTNREIYSSIDSPDIIVTPAIINKIRTEGELNFNNGNSEAIAFLYPQGNKEAVVIASAFDQSGLNKLNFLKWILIIAYSISMIIILIAGWIFSTEALKPISKVVNEVDKISVLNIDAKVNEGNGTDEIANLAITFNKMLTRLRTSFEFQKNFVANASHELRTPLTALTGQISVALLNDRSPEEYRDTLHSLQKDIRNLNDLTNRLLELAQVNRDISEIKFQPLRIDECLLTARSEIIKRFPAYKVQINFEELPELESSMIVSANEQLLQTAFVNLIENGCKFSDNKQVEILLRALNNSVEIKFKDEGIGIHELEINHVFEPLYRTANSRTVSGHGLGLSLTQKIILIHKGAIHIFSRVNIGTTVTVILPCKK